MNSSELNLFLERHGLTDFEFAELLGVTGMAVHHWLTGKRAISLTVTRLCQLFDRRPELMAEFLSATKVG